MRLLELIAYGDALGAPFETNDGSRHQKLATWNGVSFLPNPRLGLEPGYGTDDTVLTQALMEALIACNGRYRREVVRESYMNAGKKHPNCGWGAYLKHFFKTGSSKIIANEKTGWTIGNGALMRCAPLAFIANTIEELYALCVLDASITHPHIDVYASCFVYTAFLREGWLFRWIEDLGQLIQRPYHDTARILSVVGIGESRSNSMVSKFNRGDVFSTLATVMYALDTHSMYEACRLAVSFGGDTDSRAALVAAGFWNKPFDRRVLGNLQEIEAIDEKFSKFAITSRL